jgi:hypothetical protein
MNLIERLASEYGWGDKPVGNLITDHLYVVDDRAARDYDARGKLFLWFCAIFVRIVGNREVEVLLTGDIPSSSEVERLFVSFGAKVSDSEVVFTVEPDSLQRLDSLAVAFQRIIAPGKRYRVKSYKYVCRRTAHSLIRLRGRLSGFWLETDPATVSPLLRQLSLNLHETNRCSE